MGSRETNPRLLLPETPKNGLTAARPREGEVHLLHTVIKTHTYQDSVTLMFLSNQLKEMEGVSRISILMGTPANKDIFRDTGFMTPEVEKATPNDICIVIDTDDERLVGEVVTKIDDFIANQVAKSKSSAIPSARSWDTAMNRLRNANLSLISIPGQYAASEARKALNRGLHVFLFSDNVTFEDELELKETGKKNGLIVMGPDCGTGIISGVPLAFANAVNKGTIGVVGASGSGIQEVTSLIHRLGGGISHALGTGGRDLSERIGALTDIEALKALASDKHTDVIVLISKPSAVKVRNKVVSVLEILPKPVVAVFMGDRPSSDYKNVHYSHTLEKAAQRAFALSKEHRGSDFPQSGSSENILIHKAKHLIRGLYSGGTLAAEAAMLMRESFGGTDSSEHTAGIMMQLKGHTIIDVGDDMYTRGRLHPMIDPSLRSAMIEEAVKDQEVSIILFDIVLGYGAHEDPAGALLPSILKATSIALQRGSSLIFIASVCGTDKDPQNYDRQVEKLREVGVIVEESNAKAVQRAITLAGPVYTEEVSERIMNLLNEKPQVINVGLRSFAETLHRSGAEVVQYDWAPVARGNEKLASILEKLG